MADPLDHATPAHRLKEVAALFLKLGFTSFGGPAAHIALMHVETVERRKWLSDRDFLDLLGATNLIPGPSSTEMAIHIGLRRAGWPGLIVAGACFIVPSVLIVLVLAWLYVRLGSTPQVEWLLYGVKPVMIAIVLQALWLLGRKAVRDRLGAGALVLVFFLFLLKVNEIALLLACGLAVMAAAHWRRQRSHLSAALLLPAGGAGLASLASVPITLPKVFLIFLKIGSVLYGSGYVLLAFLRADLVTRYGWLTDPQLIDAVAIGQLTPGPVFTTATFIGFLLAGVPGALLATLGIFLPSFLLVALSNPLIPRMRNSVWIGSFLDGVNVASLALMAAVALQLGRASLVDAPTTLLALAALVALLRFKVTSTWLVAAGALIGVLAGLR